MCVSLVVFSSLRGGFTHCSASEIPIGYLWQADWPWIFLSPLVVAKRRSFSSLLSKMNQRGGDKSYGQHTPPLSTTKTGQTLLNCRSIFPMTDMTSKLFKLKCVRFRWMFCSHLNATWEKLSLSGCRHEALNQNCFTSGTCRKTCFIISVITSTFKMEDSVCRQQRILPNDLLQFSS